MALLVLFRVAASGSSAMPVIFFFFLLIFFGLNILSQLISGSGYDYKSVRRWTTQRKLGYSLFDCDKVNLFLYTCSATPYFVP